MCALDTGGVCDSARAVRQTTGSDTGRTGPHRGRALRRTKKRTGRVAGRGTLAVRAVRLKRGSILESAFDTRHRSGRSGVLSIHSFALRCRANGVRYADTHSILAASWRVLSIHGTVYCIAFNTLCGAVRPKRSKLTVACSPRLPLYSADEADGGVEAAGARGAGGGAG